MQGGRDKRLASTDRGFLRRQHGCATPWYDNASPMQASSAASASPAARLLHLAGSDSGLSSAVAVANGGRRISNTRGRRTSGPVSESSDEPDMADGRRLKQVEHVSTQFGWMVSEASSRLEISCERETHGGPIGRLHVSGERAVVR